MADLESLAAEASTCVRCPLAAGRTQVVFGTGNPHADLMFVGEGPGAEEDAQGLPFVGRSGRLLDRLVLEEMGLTRADVYISNTVKCLRYNAQVQLGDGSWERIGRLVRGRYGGTVMSVDPDGTLVRRRVVGWHATPLAGRRVFRLTYQSARRAGAGRVGVELTGDHPVLTDAGYVAVEDLTLRHRIATGQGLSSLARDVVYGTLLGDGHLDRRRASIQFSHKARHGSYARWKAELLAELHPTVSNLFVSAAVGAERMHAIVAVQTRAHRALVTLRPEFYVPKKHVPSWLSAHLTPRAVAIWYMDAGHLRLRAGRAPDSEIATCSFSEQDLAVLVRGLENLGVTARPRRGRLQFGVAATRDLSRLIASFVPPVMRYKLHPKVAETLPYEPELFIPGPAEVTYDTAEIQEITDRPRSDVTFFCIDVEETQNFVTAGGVVHNCRPPGNRDPRPEEVEACNPWLEGQLELIAPKVVVTLGNFASKLLLGSTLGITRLRGKVYPWRGGVLVPTFHPAAVLRGGSEPTAQMRADLVRAKLALQARP